MNLLQIRGLNQSYGGSHTLWDIDLDVAVGTRLCLMGRNGTGKTTLLKCIMGLIPVTSGEITFDGMDLRSLPAESRARVGVGYVPQGREIFPQLTVEENLKIGLTARQDRQGHSGPSVRVVSSAKADAPTAWRGPVGRAAATTRNGTGSGAGTEVTYLG